MAKKSERNILSGVKMSLSDNIGMRGTFLVGILGGGRIFINYFLIFFIFCHPRWMPYHDQFATLLHECRLSVLINNVAS